MCACSSMLSTPLKSRQQLGFSRSWGLPDCRALLPQRGTCTPRQTPSAGQPGRTHATVQQLWMVLPSRWKQSGQGRARTVLQQRGRAEVDAAQVAQRAARVLAGHLALQQQVLRLQVAVHHAPVHTPSMLRISAPSLILQFATPCSLTTIQEMGAPRAALPQIGPSCTGRLMSSSTKDKVGRALGVAVADDLQDGARIHRRVALRQVAPLHDQVEELAACFGTPASPGVKPLRMVWRMQERTQGQWAPSTTACQLSRRAS